MKKGGKIPPYSNHLIFDPAGGHPGGGRDGHPPGLPATAARPGGGDPGPGRGNDRPAPKGGADREPRAGRQDQGRRDRGLLPDPAWSAPAVRAAPGGPRATLLDAPVR